LQTWRRRAAERRELARLDTRQWTDIARDPDTIRREIRKPFWKP
jgi:uncharacterized protein YjiS (DUF1127 family)